MLALIMAIAIHMAPALPACDDEDGTVTSNGKEVAACYWDAQTQGNGLGTSFVAIR